MLTLCRRGADKDDGAGLIALTGLWLVAALFVSGLLFVWRT